MTDLVNKILKEANSFSEKKTPKRLITEKSLNRLIGFHAKRGMIIISASRSERTTTENEIATENLKKDIRSKGYAFIPVLGGYIETVIEDGIEKKKEETEVSFVVPLKDSKEDLFNLGKELCKKYNQETFLFSVNGEKPRYYNSEGEVEMEFNGNYILNNKLQTYFTRISKDNAPKNGSKFGKTDRRFTMESVYYINSPSPTIAGNTVRLAKGEYAIYSEKEILNEAKQVGKIYHFTTFHNLISILKLGIIKPSKVEIPGQKESSLGVSTTRDKNFNSSFNRLSTGVTGVSVRIELDGDKLSEIFKIIPFNYFKKINDLTRPEQNESEEVVLTGKKGIDIKKFVKMITIIPSEEVSKYELKNLEGIGKFIEKKGLQYSIKKSK